MSGLNEWVGQQGAEGCKEMCKKHVKELNEWQKSAYDDGAIIFTTFVGSPEESKCVMERMKADLDVKGTHEPTTAKNVKGRMRRYFAMDKQALVDLPKEYTDSGGNKAMMAAEGFYHMKSMGRMLHDAEGWQDRGLMEDEELAEFDQEKVMDTQAKLRKRVKNEMDSLEVELDDLHEGVIKVVQKKDGTMDVLVIDFALFTDIFEGGDFDVPGDRNEYRQFFEKGREKEMKRAIERLDKPMNCKEVSSTIVIWSAGNNGVKVNINDKEEVGSWTTMLGTAVCASAAEVTGEVTYESQTAVEARTNPGKGSVWFTCQDVWGMSAQQRDDLGRIFKQKIKELADRAGIKIMKGGVRTQTPCCMAPAQVVVKYFNGECFEFARRNVCRRDNCSFGHHMDSITGEGEVEYDDDEQAYIRKGTVEIRKSKGKGRDTGRMHLGGHGGGGRGRGGGGGGGGRGYGGGGGPGVATPKKFGGAAFGGASFKPTAYGNQPAMAANTPMAAKAVVKSATGAVNAEIERVKGQLNGQYAELEKRLVKRLDDQGAETAALTRRAEKTERGVEEMFEVLQQKMEALNKTMDARVDDSRCDWQREVEQVDELVRELENFKWRMKEGGNQEEDEMVEKLRSSLGGDEGNQKAMEEVKAVWAQMEANRQGKEIERMERQIAKARIGLKRAMKRREEQTAAQKELKAFTTVLGNGISGFQRKLLEGGEQVEELDMDIDQELETPERGEDEMESASVTSPELEEGDGESGGGSPTKRQKSENKVEPGQDGTGRELNMDFEASVEPEAVGPSAMKYMEGLKSYQDLMAIANHEEKQSMESYANSMETTRGEYRMDEGMLVEATKRAIKRTMDTAEARICKEKAEAVQEERAKAARTSGEQEVTVVEKKTTVVEQEKEAATMERERAAMTQPKIDDAMGTSSTAVAGGSRRKVSTKIGDGKKVSGGGGSGSGKKGNGSGASGSSSGSSTKGRAKSSGGRDGSRSSGRETRSNTGTPVKRTREHNGAGDGTPSTELGRAVGQMAVASPPEVEAVGVDTMEDSTGVHSS